MRSPRASFAGPETASQDVMPPEVLSLDEQVRALSAERDELEEQWLLLAEDG